jgi:MFS family permease
MQQVLFSWLVVGELRAAPEVMGAVTLTNSFPVLLLLLVAGVTADRVERRRMIALLHLGSALATGALAAAVWRDALSLPVVFVYAAAAGTFMAFVIPTRDAMLSDVVEGDLMRAVTAVTLAQFGGQATGSLLAGSARFLDLAPTIALQAGLTGCAALVMTTLPRSQGTGARRIDRREILGGLAEVAASPTMRATLLLMSGVGLFLAGAYFVVLPILVRDHYHGDVARLALFITTLQVGTVVGAAILLATRRLERRGRALAVSLALTALPLLVLALGVPFAAALGAAFFWGLCVAAFNSIGRGGGRLRAARRARHGRGRDAGLRRRRRRRHADRAHCVSAAHTLRGCVWRVSSPSCCCSRPRCGLASPRPRTRPSPAPSRTRAVRFSARSGARRRRSRC